MYNIIFVISSAAAKMWSVVVAHDYYVKFKDNVTYDE